MATIKEIEALLNAKLDEKLKPVSDLAKTLNEAMDKIGSLEEENRFLKKQLHSLVISMDSLENQDRRMNVIVHGVKENQTETWEMTEQIVIQEFQRAGVTIDSAKIQRAHRVHSRAYPRPIIIKFTDYKAREHALKNGKTCFRSPGSEIRVTEDLTRRARTQRSLLRPIQEEAYKNGHKTFFKRGDLVVNDVLFQVDTVYKTTMAITKEGEQEVKTKEEVMAIINKGSTKKRQASSPLDRGIRSGGKTLFYGRRAGTSGETNSRMGE